MSVNLGGGNVLQFSSNTIAPQMMRDMREGLENGSLGYSVQFFP